MHPECLVWELWPVRPHDWIHRTEDDHLSGGVSVLQIGIRDPLPGLCFI